MDLVFRESRMERFDRFDHRSDEDETRVRHKNEIVEENKGNRVLRFNASVPRQDVQPSDPQPLGDREFGSLRQRREHV